MKRRAVGLVLALLLVGLAVEVAHVVAGCEMAGAGAQASVTGVPGVRVDVVRGLHALTVFN